MHYGVFFLKYIYLVKKVYEIKRYKFRQIQYINNM